MLFIHKTLGSFSDWTHLNKSRKYMQTYLIILLTQPAIENTTRISKSLFVQLLNFLDKNKIMYFFFFFFKITLPQSDMALLLRCMSMIANDFVIFLHLILGLMGSPVKDSVAISLFYLKKLGDREYQMLLGRLSKELACAILLRTWIYQ